SRIVAQIPGKRPVFRRHDGNADLFARRVAGCDGIDLIYKVQEISLRMGVTVTSALVVVAFEADIHRLHQRPSYSRHYTKKNSVANLKVKLYHPVALNENKRKKKAQSIPRSFVRHDEISSQNSD